MRHTVNAVIDVILIGLCAKMGVDFLLDGNYPPGFIYVLFAIKTYLSSSFIAEKPIGIEIDKEVWDKMMIDSMKPLTATQIYWDEYWRKKDEKETTAD